MNPVPFLIGLGVLVVLYVFFYGIWSKSWNPVELFVGDDKRPSSSKFQFFVWTVVALYSYAVLYAARALQGYYAVIGNIPRNLLIAMGISVVTATAAKGITVGYLQTGRVAKSEPSETTKDPKNPTKNVKGTKLRAHGGLSYILLDDEGRPDLVKLQMIAWTFIAVSVYLVSMIALVNALPRALDGVTDEGKPVLWSTLSQTFLEEHPSLLERISLPDISAALMVLMGLGQGAYLGKKLVSANTARLTLLSPAAGKPGTEVIVSGLVFSGAADGNIVLLDGKPLHGPAEVANNASQIKFIFPEARPDGAPWPAGQAVMVETISDGQGSANALPFTVTYPAISRLSASQVPAGSALTLFGQGFGATQQGGSLSLIDGNPVPAQSWKEREITVTIPAAHPKGVHQIGLNIDGKFETNTLPFTVT